MSLERNVLAARERGAGKAFVNGGATRIRLLRDRRAESQAISECRIGMDLQKIGDGKVAQHIDTSHRVANLLQCLRHTVESFLTRAGELVEKVLTELLAHVRY